MQSRDFNKGWRKAGQQLKQKESIGEELPSKIRRHPIISDALLLYASKRLP